MTVRAPEPRRCGMATALRLRRARRQAQRWRPWRPPSVVRFVVAVTVATVALIAVARGLKAAEAPAARIGWAVEFCPAGLACSDLTEARPSRTTCLVELAVLRIDAKGARVSCERRSITAEASR